MSMCDNCIHNKVCLLPKTRENCNLFDEVRLHGEWVWKKDETALRDYDFICSNCGDKIFTCENYDSIEQAKAVVDSLVASGKTMPNFCKKCGSDNRKENEK